MNLNEIGRIIAILQDAGQSDESFCAEHDIIYLPWHEEEGEVADQLEAIGCHWDEAGCWTFFS